MLGPIGAFGINKDPKAGGRRHFHTINILRVPTGIPCGREVREMYVSFCMLPGTAQGQIKAQVSPIANSVGQKSIHHLQEKNVPLSGSCMYLASQVSAQSLELIRFVAFTVTTTFPSL